MLNHVVLHGRLLKPAETQVLPSEETVTRLEVRIEAGPGPADTVPVVWYDPPAWPATLDAGEAVVVVGRVRRRYFRSSGTTQSRTEVVVAAGARPGPAGTATRLLVGALAALEAAALDVDGDVDGDVHGDGGDGRGEGRPHLGAG